MRENKDHRVQFKLPKRGGEALEGLKKLSGASSKTAVVLNAILVYAYLLRCKGDGEKVRILVDDQEGNTKEVILPGCGLS